MLALATNVSPILNSCDIAHVGPSEKAVGPFGWIESDQHAAGDHLLVQAIVFFFGPVAPINATGFAQLSNVFDPLNELLIFDKIRNERR